MPFDIIPTRFGIVPTRVRAKSNPEKGADCLPFSLLE